MGQAPQSSRIIVLGEQKAAAAPDDSSAQTTDPGPMAPSSPHVGDTDPGLQATSTAPMFLGIPAEAAVEQDVEADALLDALAPRNLPEVTTTSGEVAAVYATDDATPAPRHHTPVPEPAVIVPDPRREPTRRIPREWVEPLSALAKEAMDKRSAPSMSNARWGAIGLVGGVVVIAGIMLGMQLAGTAEAPAAASAAVPLAAPASAAFVHAAGSAPEAVARVQGTIDLVPTPAGPAPKPAVALEDFGGTSPQPASSQRVRTKPAGSAPVDLDYKRLK